MRILFFILITGFAANVRSAVCEIEGSAKPATACFGRLCRPSERMSKIEFPDHRSIFLIGHNHGERGPNYETYTSLMARPFDAISLAAKLVAAEQKMHVSITQNSADEAQLLELVATYPQLKFIGEEADAVGYEALAESYRPGFTALKNFSESNGLDTKVMSQVFKVIVGLPTYLNLERPEWAKALQFKGFEWRVAIDAAIRAESESERLRKLVEQAYRSRSSMSEELSEANGQIISLRTNDDFASPIEEAQHLNKILAAPELGDQAHLVAQYIKSVYTANRRSMARDQVVARNLAREKQTGVLLVGHAHLMTLGRFVREECLKEAAAAK